MIHGAEHGHGPRQTPFVRRFEPGTHNAVPEERACPPLGGQRHQSAGRDRRSVETRPPLGRNATADRDVLVVCQRPPIGRRGRDDEAHAITAWTEVADGGKRESARTGGGGLPCGWLHGAGGACISVDAAGPVRVAGSVRVILEAGGARVSVDVDRAAIRGRSSLLRLSGRLGRPTGIDQSERECDDRIRRLDRVAERLRRDRRWRGMPSVARDDLEARTDRRRLARPWDARLDATHTRRSDDRRWPPGHDRPRTGRRGLRCDRRRRFDRGRGFEGTGPGRLDRDRRLPGRAGQRGARGDIRGDAGVGHDPLTDRRRSMRRAAS